ncbi:MAG: CBS domain-containing protein [Thiolinea sp.]
MRDLANPALEVSSTASIRETAIKMSDAATNMALVTDAEGLLCGVVTDQDFRKRVVASNLDINGRVEQIMTPNPYTLPPSAPASEAVLLMARRNFRHLPIVSRQDQRIVGVVSTTDLLRSQSHNAVYLVGDIHMAKDVQTLQNPQHPPAQGAGQHGAQQPAGL